MNPVDSVRVENNIVKVTITGTPDRPGTAARLFSSLAREGINVGSITQASSFREGFIDISFTVAESSLDSTVEVCRVAAVKVGADEAEFNSKVARIVVSGPGIADQPGVAADVFAVLADLSVNIEMITTTENFVSCIVSEEDAERAARAVRSEFEL